MANNAPFTIKDENIYVYELETNDAYKFEEKSPEEQEAIKAQNTQYLEDLRVKLLDKARPCECLMPEIVDRARRRAMIAPGTLNVGPNGQVTFQPEQSDVDKKDFAVIIDETEGYYGRTRCIVSHCKSCGALQFWGELTPISTMLAQAFVDNDVRELQTIIDAKKANDGPTFVLENVETGEKIPADDIMKGLANMTN